MKRMVDTLELFLLSETNFEYHLQLFRIKLGYFRYRVQILMGGVGEPTK